MRSLCRSDSVRRVVVERRARRPDDVVGEQARTGVADDRRDGLRLPGDLGLMPERLQLPADLARQVAQPGEVRLHRVQLAEGLLLAAAVLQDAGGLLDEAAPVLRARVEHRVQLALADDHVHLAAETRVAQQLLHVEQPAGGLPLIAYSLPPLRNSVREIVTSEYSIGSAPSELSIVELHLGAPERTARGGAGEDDVLHLAAAQRLGALLAHHPGERVDDVRLAGAVRADDAGDARLEGEGRRLRERLEALERQALQIHADDPSTHALPASRLPDRTTPSRRARESSPAGIGCCAVRNPIGPDSMAVTGPPRRRRSADAEVRLLDRRVGEQLACRCPSG